MGRYLDVDGASEPDAAGLDDVYQLDGGIEGAHSGGENASGGDPRRVPYGQLGASKDYQVGKLGSEITTTKSITGGQTRKGGFSDHESVSLPYGLSRYLHEHPKEGSAVEYLNYPWPIERSGVGQQRSSYAQIYETTVSHILV